MTEIIHECSKTDSVVLRISRGDSEKGENSWEQAREPELDETQIIDRSLFTELECQDSLRAFFQKLFK